MSEVAGKTRTAHAKLELRAMGDPPKQLAKPSLLARYTCASILMCIFAIWGKYTFVDEETELQVGEDMHSYKIPLGFTVFYLVSLPVLRELIERFASVDMKLLLKESMILYNAGQVVLNAWMVYRMLDAVILRGHPFVGGIQAGRTGATYAVWVHYCDKYLEFLDTYFMVLRGKMDQVSFLHVYHHFTIAWAWWIGIWFWPEGDCYFGALLNSLIHVMMYSYYTMSLLRISCPWKKYLTMAQLTQFTTVVIYSMVSLCVLPSDTHWKHYSALTCQCGEMISLFLLFLHFYKKSYRKASSSGGEKGEERIPAAPKETSVKVISDDDKVPESPLRASDSGSEVSTDSEEE